MTDSGTLNLERQVAVMESELKHVREDVGKVEKRLEHIEGALLEIRDFMSRARGGWVALATAATAGGAIVGLILKLLPWPH